MDNPPLPPDWGTPPPPLPSCRFSAELYEAGYPRIVNVDISEVCIAQMRVRHRDLDRMEWHVKDCTRLDFPDSTFDLVRGRPRRSPPPGYLRLCTLGPLGGFGFGILVLDGGRIPIEFIQFCMPYGLKALKILTALRCKFSFCFISPIKQTTQIPGGSGPPLPRRQLSLPGRR